MDVYHAALFLRQEVLALRTPPRLASATGLISATPDVPNLLYNFLAWLMYGDVPLPPFLWENAMTSRLMFIAESCLSPKISFFQQPVVTSSKQSISVVNGRLPSNWKQAGNYTA